MIPDSNEYFDVAASPYNSALRAYQIIDRRKYGDQTDRGGHGWDAA